MNERVKKLSEEIRKLTSEEQADLIDELLALTHRDPDEEAWAREMHRRLNAVERGEAITIDARKALRKYKTS